MKTVLSMVECPPLETNEQAVIDAETVLSTGEFPLEASIDGEGRTMPVGMALAALKYVAPIRNAIETISYFASNLRYPYTGFEHVIAAATGSLPDVGVVSPRDHLAAANTLWMEQPQPPLADSYLGNDGAIPLWTPISAAPPPSSFSFPKPRVESPFEYSENYKTEPLGTFPTILTIVPQILRPPTIVSPILTIVPKILRPPTVVSPILRPPPGFLSSLRARVDAFLNQSERAVQGSQPPHRNPTLSRTLPSSPKDRPLVVIHSWTDMTPEELKALILDAIAPLQQALVSLQQSNEALRIQVESLAANRTQILSSQASARQTELEARKKMIDNELRSIADKTWKAPFENYDWRLVMANSFRDGDARQWKTARFDPALMPKFKVEDDLEQWISEIQIEVDIFGEELICSLIWRHCFMSNSSVKNWYSILGGRMQAFMTKDEGCWLYFMQKMREVWSKPLVVAQREAEDRTKLPNEMFYQFFFSKLKLLTSAFPESHSTTHISRIRAKFNDMQADRYIRERQSIAAFGEECREYDKHLKMYPVSGNPGSLSCCPQFTYTSSYQTTPALAWGSLVGMARGTITPAQSRKRLVE